MHARRWGGITPLHEAAGENTHAGVVTALVEAGVDPNAQDRDGVAPLHLAAGHGSPAVVTALVAAGADLNVRGLSGKTPLGVAWPDGMNGYPSAYRVPVVRELLRLGADGFGGKDLSQITNPTWFFPISGGRLVMRVGHRGRGRGLRGGSRWRSQSVPGCGSRGCVP